MTSMKKVVPTRLDLDSKLKFKCHPGIACFTKCCSAIDIILTPYDIVRMKNRLGLSSEEFLEKYTVSKVDVKSWYPHVFLKMNEDEERKCPFVTLPEGCTIYSDRPASCRYYPVGQATHRREEQNEIVNDEFYMLVKEEHCLGFQEDKLWTIAEWREDQEVAHYDDLNRTWKDILMKRDIFPKEPDEKKQAQFFLASYDMDRFRRFVFESHFLDIFEVDAETQAKIKEDDTELLEFAFRYLKYLFLMDKGLVLKDQIKEEVYRKAEAEKAAREAAQAASREAALEEFRRLEADVLATADEVEEADEDEN